MGTLLGNLSTSTTATMNTFLFFSTMIAFGSAAPQGLVPGVAGPYAAAPYLVRAPSHDSASIEHHRLGGNFAYSTAEAHAFAEVVPQISTLTHPVAETTHTHIPAAIATHQPSPIIQTHHVAQPIFKNIPTYGSQVISGPVRTHQTISQPLVHETRTHSVQQVATPIHTPFHAVEQVPVGVQQSVQHVGYAAHAVAAPAYAAGVAGYAVLPAAAGYAGYAGVPALAGGYAGLPALAGHQAVFA